jgi:MoaA/NifB/PqqE/SkfB family radical SAM enzyme
MRPGSQPLENMGFFTLTDARCAATTSNSPLGRCVLVLTESCNFACPYCRSHTGRHLPSASAREVLRIWADNGLFALVLTGGEPTLHPDLPGIVRFAKGLGIPRLCVATNGAAGISLYRDLWENGVDEFSISLDADNPEDGAALSGRGPETWHRVVDNIRTIAGHARVTVGLVISETNVNRSAEVVRFALDLGVSDVRVNPAAQYSAHLPALDLEPRLVRDHPILAWRLANSAEGIGVRGLQDDDPGRCWLALDEMTVNKGEHYPCFVHMREGGKPIGPMRADVREQRARWVALHDPRRDPICRANCPDCLVSFNRRYELLHPRPAGVVPA